MDNWLLSVPSFIIASDARRRNIHRHVRVIAKRHIAEKGLHYTLLTFCLFHLLCLKFS